MRVASALMDGTVLAPIAVSVSWVGAHSLAPATKISKLASGLVFWPFRLQSEKKVTCVPSPLNEGDRLKPPRMFPMESVTCRKVMWSGAGISATNTSILPSRLLPEPVRSPVDQKAMRRPSPLSDGKLLMSLVPSVMRKGVEAKMLLSIRADSIAASGTAWVSMVRVGFWAAGAHSDSPGHWMGSPSHWIGCGGDCSEGVRGIFPSASAVSIWTSAATAWPCVSWSMVSIWRETVPCEAARVMKGRYVLG